MTKYADLEVGLHRREADSYAVEFRFVPPDSETDVRLGQGRLLQPSFSLEELRKLRDDPVAYGRALTQSFFADSVVKTDFAQSLASAQSLGALLRLRLTIGPTAPALHSVLWETLQDPDTGKPLATSEQILFSRYMSGADWRPVQLRAKSNLQAVVMVANPSDLSDYNLYPINVDDEFERIRNGLGDIPASYLPRPNSPERATINNLMDVLRTQMPDILYLICHGALIEDEAWLWFENNQGKAERVSGSELVTRFSELQNRPRLLVLAACESAGSRAGNALVALGPRLAEVGIPAVLAMQDKVSTQTVAEFLSVFFRELQRDGQIDQAMAVARGTVRHRPDHWVPVLLTRLKSGRIWYVPGFSGNQDDFQKWSGLAGFVQQRLCTPIIGPGLVERMFFSRREIASSWADKHSYPLSPHDRDVLPRVAQYVSTHQSPAYLHLEMREIIRDGLMRHYRDVIPVPLQLEQSWSHSQLSRVISIAADQHASNTVEDAYTQLAQLRLPIYVTAEPFDILERALIRVGAQPIVRLCPWTRLIPEDRAVFEDEPTAERPLVYHLFGHISIPNSTVLSEDQYFDYLIGVTLNKRLIPSAVRAALTNTALLFLGFQIDDWEFRVFFRYLMAQEGREMLKFFSHATAQVEPEADRIADAARTHRFLEDYFQSENISIFWGSTEEFLTTLRTYL